ncbi:alpha/beta hydrolase [Sporichthya sp.]|uniref:alpha/beta fold hydrolase n=1 Tax=Sporichthya sp. TaxID=65475 RepID=UPI00183C3DEF|nr:alpha/beta hydrolase [Sporichthya sp.]MBA3743788.1 alpha/beta fold hydrolase [Sporichthya sp.]
MDLPVQHFKGRDGVELAYREVGEGRALVLIHGFFSSATINWVRYGTAAALADRGFRVVMPDLRAHGDSAKPHDASAYPKDVLAEDGEALLEHLGLTDYDLGGYSLGARTVTRMLVRGARPRRAILAGMGLEGILGPLRNRRHFVDVLTAEATFERGTPEFMSQAFLRTTGGDPQALIHVLDTQVDTSREDLAAIPVPTAIVLGDEDDNGSGEGLAGALAEGYFVPIPGTHMGAVTRPELAAAFGAFLTD